METQVSDTLDRLEAEAKEASFRFRNWASYIRSLDKTTGSLAILETRIEGVLANLERIPILISEARKEKQT